MRPHVTAVYAFARTADDFADEDGYTLEERHARLDEWHTRLERASRGLPSRDGDAPPAEADLIFDALAHTIRRCSLEVRLLEDLLSAFRQDTVVSRYATWEEVFDYCRRSANPVGRLVLRIAGYRDEALDRASDALCTALQLTNFWQDLAVDWARGRLYVPLTERDTAGALDSDLDGGRMTPAWQSALGHAAGKTRRLFDLGRPVCDGVHGRLRYELRLTWLAARRVLDRLERARFDVFDRRPTLGLPDAAPLGWQLLTWTTGASGKLTLRSDAS
jgi:phytoene synthase